MKNAKLLASYLAPILCFLMGSTLTVTDIPVTGTFTAARLNSRFAQIEAWGNGGIGDANISSSEPLSVSKIANDGAYYAISAQIPCDNDTPAYLTQVPATSTLVAAFANCHECDASDSYTVNVQVGGATKISFAGLDDVLQSSTGNSFSVATGTDLEIDVNSATNSACLTGVDGIEVTVWLKSQHVAM